MRLQLANARDDEAGFTLVFFALTVVMLMMFVAFTVDLGGGLDERREDVTAADSAATGSIQEFMSGDDVMRDKAIELANFNLEEALLISDFDTCAGDPNRLDVLAPSANCISFNAARTQIRVKLPTRSVRYFGGAAGLPEVSHNAAATAEIVREGFGGVLPFGLQNGTDGHGCLKTGPVDLPPCNGPTSGNFGTLGFRFVGNESLGTTTSCTVGDPGQVRLMNNMAVSIDHSLSAYGADPYGFADVTDQQSCDDPENLPFPNGTNGDTGNTPNVLGNGMFSAGSGTYSDGGPARLGRSLSDWWGAGERTTVAGWDIDDTALWEYIPPEDGTEGSPIVGTNVPDSCQRDQFIDDDGTDGSGQGDGSNIDPATWAYVSATYPAPRDRLRVLMERCFEHYQGDTWNDFGTFAGEASSGCSGSCDDPVFGRDSLEETTLNLIDMQRSPRFAYVPELEGALPTGSGDVRFVRFKAVFMHRLCNGNNVSSCAIHEPGFGQSVGGADQRANYITAFIFEDDMLPKGLSGPFAPFDVGVNLSVQLIR